MEDSVRVYMCQECEGFFEELDEKNNCDTCRQRKSETKPIDLLGIWLSKYATKCSTLFEAIALSGESNFIEQVLPNGRKRRKVLCQVFDQIYEVTDENMVEFSTGDHPKDWYVVEERALEPENSEALPIHVNCYVDAEKHKQMGNGLLYPRAVGGGVRVWIRTCERYEKRRICNGCGALYDPQDEDNPTFCVFCKSVDTVKARWDASQMKWMAGDK